MLSGEGEMKEGPIAMIQNDRLELFNDLVEGRVSRREFVKGAIILGFSASAIGTLLAACSNTNSGGQAGTLSGTIKMYKGPFAANEVDLENVMISSFTKKFPNLSVKLDLFDWTTVEAQCAQSFASNAHDVVYMPENIYARFAPQGGPLLDLSHYVNDPSWSSEKNAIGSNFWTNAHPRGAPLNAVPYVTQPNSMYFVNLDLLQQAGVGSDWNASYENLRAASQKVRALGANYYGFGIRTNGMTNFGWFDWLGYIRRTGRDLLSSDWSKPDLDNAEAAGAVQYLADIIHSDKSSVPYGQYTWPAMRDLFAAGRVAIMHDEATFVGVLGDKPKFKWGVAQFPSQTTGIWKNNQNLSITGVFTVAKATKMADASWELIKHWSQLAQVKPYFEAVTIMSVRTDAASVMWQNSPVLNQIQKDYVPRERGPQLHPKINQMVEGVQPLIDSAYRGELSGAAAMKQAAQAVSSLL